MNFSLVLVGTVNLRQSFSFFVIFAVVLTKSKSESIKDVNFASAAKVIRPVSCHLALSALTH